MADTFDLNALNAQLASDPQWQALVKNWQQHGTREMGKGNAWKYSQDLQPFRDYFKAKGITIPSDVAILPASGKLDQSWTNTYGGALGLSALEFAGMAAGGYGLAAAGAGGGAGAGTTAVGAGTGGAAGAGGALGTTATYAGTAALPGAGSTVAGVAGGAGTAAGTAGTFGRFVQGLGGSSTLVGAGVSLVGDAIAAYQAGKATDAQTALAKQALGLQAQEYNTNTGLNVAQANQKSQAYNTTLANLAPYRGAGAAALSDLGYGLGLPGYEHGNTSVVNAPPPSVPVRPLSVPPPISVNGQPGQSIPNQAYIPTNQQTGGAPQMSTGNNWNPGTAQTNGQPPMPTVGQKGVINGQAAVWDGKGWKAA